MIKSAVNSTWESLALNLNQPQQLVDNRDGGDWLNFIARFAELINFYDKNNTLSGNWSPFMMKDPYILATVMSKTDVAYQNTRFVNTCTRAKTAEADKYPPIFNDLFDNILSVFRQIESWTAAMQLTTLQYELKTHTLNEVKDSYSQFLWAFLDLRLYLSKNNSALLILPPYTDYYQNYDAIIWKTNKDKQPYWAVLGQDSAETMNNPNTLLEVLTENGNHLFSFFKSLRDMAWADLPILGKQTDPFPDTLLLRSFIELMQLNQLKTNSLAHDHLNFYYSNILKQVKQPAQPDCVFISTVLAKNNAIYNLASGTLFSAGVDANKNPILFKTVSNQSLNPAQIAAVHTLSVGTDIKNNQILLLAENTLPSTVQTDAKGAVKSWNTFGTSTPDSINVPQSMGIAFASPELLLEEGQRQLMVTLVFYDTIEVEAFNNPTFALSTSTAWFIPSTDQISSIAPAGSVNTWQITINLQVTDPPIVPFTVATDGYLSAWPVFKILFADYPSLASPPPIQQVTFSTQVAGLRNFTLSNDNGSLNPAKPFQLFGPIANLGSVFYMGHPEIFSKKLDSFTLELDWDALPTDFATYYAVYNMYLQGQLTPIKVKSIAPTTAQNVLNKVTLGLFKAGAKAVETVADTTANGFTNPFEDSSFKVNFDLLNMGKWLAVNLDRKSDCVQTGISMGCNAPVVPDNAPPLNNLFNMDSKNPANLASNTFYQYTLNPDGSNALPYNPLIQNQPVSAISDQTNFGFLRMTLAAPSNGFGSNIYPQVVSQVALYNASALINTPAGSTPNVVATPNIPFAPTLKGFLGSYEASHTFTFDYGYKVNNIDILECYHYSAFENYLVYDTTQPQTNYQNQIGLPVIGLTRNMQGITLYPSFAFDAVMYLELTQVLPSNAISFYFELAESPFRVPDTSYSLSYLYLGKNGWTKLKVLTDSTQNLTCSGLMVFDFPADFNDTHIQMPSGSFWCAVLLTGAEPNEMAKTSFLQTNGLKLTRTGTTFLSDFQAPQIAAGQLTGPAQAIPQISTTVQPFSSFGGRGAEDEARRNLRVANRLKTKSRAITQADYKRIIAENFDDIFYSKLWFDPSKRAIDIYLVKSVENAQVKNAFLPLVSACLEGEVARALATASGATNLNVQNFSLLYVTVTATVFISSAYELESTALRLEQALKIFMSPWIKSDSPQMLIDQGITDVQVASFFAGFNEVTAVGDVKFKLSSKDKREDKNLNHGKLTTLMPTDPSVLLVPDINQFVTCKAAV